MIADVSATHHHPSPSPWSVAFALALGAAVSLGLARFSYALILPAMRADLGWSYFTAGAMNTLNAVGYLMGALLTPALMRRWGARPVFVGGALAACVCMWAHGLTREAGWLYALRAFTGAASAAIFVSGGLMAARLGLRKDLPLQLSPSLILGLYYGGTGLGIVASAVLIPALADSPNPALLSLALGLGLGPQGWPLAWAALASLGLCCAAWMLARAQVDEFRMAAAQRVATPWLPFAWGLAGYFLFGLGYIGYMTFNVTLLREQALGSGAVTAFYAVLGLGVMASPWLWADLLARRRDGRPLALLNTLLALATALPLLWAHPVAAFASGALFGSVFLSVVASTTALVRHNLPPTQWPAGISAFTIIFALGQILGPSLVGALADGRGGLAMGLAVSAAALLLGGWAASRQRALS